MEVLDEGILEVGASGEIHSANGRGLSMLGLEALPPHLHLRDAVLSEAVRRDILDEHNAFQDREALLHTANGTLPCVLSFAPARYGQGRRVGPARIAPPVRVRGPHHRGRGGLRA